MPLFEGIVSDLFPGVKLPEPDYDNLTDSLVHSIETMDLQPVDWFITKIIQVHSEITNFVVLNNIVQNVVYFLGK